MENVLTLATAALASGVIVTIVTQLLKWKLVAYPASKYPLPTAIVLSLLAAAVAVFGLNLPLNTPADYALFTFVTLIVATQSYDLTKQAVEQVKQ